jgi:hypothetical protein
LVDLTVEEGTRLKVIYGSADGFHAVDLDSASVYDIYIPKHVSVLIPLYFYLTGAVGFWPIINIQANAVKKKKRGDRMSIEALLRCCLILIQLPNKIVSVRPVYVSRIERHP